MVKRKKRKKEVSHNPSYIPPFLSSNRTTASTWTVKCSSPTCQPWLNTTTTILSLTTAPYVYRCPTHTRSAHDCGARWWIKVGGTGTRGESFWQIRGTKELKAVLGSGRSAVCRRHPKCGHRHSASAATLNRRHVRAVWLTYDTEYSNKPSMQMHLPWGLSVWHDAK